MSAIRETQIVRSAVGGALSGLALAALVGGYLFAFSSLPGGIEADAFAVYLDRPTAEAASLASTPTASPPHSYAINR
jgi:hypothetical protein